MEKNKTMRSLKQRFPKFLSAGPLEIIKMTADPLVQIKIKQNIKK
jgi:hypothetical protein